MLKIFTADQDKFEIPNFLDAVPYDPADTFSLLDEVELELLVLVERLCEFRLVAFHDIEAVLLRKTRYFCKYLAHASILYYPATNIQNLKN